MAYFRHPQALVESASIGEGTRVWAFAHILPGARVGRDCNICDHTFLEDDVVIGDRVTIKCGVQLWNGIHVEDDVFIGPNATFTNDAFPRSKHPQAVVPRTLVGRGASIGANATILPGLTIGPRSMIGAGAVVTHNVPNDAVIAGNPGRIVGYVGTGDALRAAIVGAPSTPASRSTGVRGVTLHRLPMVEDLRGLLSFGETGVHVPFPVQRYFVVFGVATQQIRGEHAHRTQEQFLVCVHGSCHVVVDDGERREEFVLDHPTVAVHVPPLVWSVQYKYSPDAVLLVLASAAYDAGDYIRGYDDFLAERRSTAARE